jgi:hypothetical protein
LQPVRLNLRHPLAVFDVIDVARQMADRLSNDKTLRVGGNIERWPDNASREARMNAAELVTVGTFPNRIEAEIAQGAMDAAGIDAMVSGDDAGGLRPHLAVGGFRLLVRTEDAEQAAAVIRGSFPRPKAKA